MVDDTQWSSRFELLRALASFYRIYQRGESEFAATGPKKDLDAFLESFEIDERRPIEFLDELEMMAREDGDG